MKKVLVTGGNGMIGEAVVFDLRARGIDAVSFDLVPPRDPLFSVQYVQGSILDRVALTNAMRGCDAVIHLAAMTGVQECRENAFDCITTNAIGTQRVLDAAHTLAVSTVLYTSSSEVYGANCDNAKEDDPVSPVSEYAVAKLCGEEMVRASIEEYGMRAFTVRFFNVYGPFQKKKFVMSRWADAVRKGEPIRIFGGGGQTRTYCYCTDAARAVVDLIARDDTECGTYNIGSRESITLNDLAHRFWAIADKHPLIKYVDWEHSDRPKTREVWARSPNTDKIHNAIGWRPSIRLDVGIEALLNVGN